MIKENYFFSRSSLSKIALNKYFSQHLYTKFFIKDLVYHKYKKVVLVDNFNFNFFVISKTYRRMFKLFLLKPGCSLISDLFIYKHSKLHFYFFENIGLNNTPQKFVSSFLKRIKYWSDKKDFFFLYKIVRGGYFGFSKGIIGFIPKIQIKLYAGSFIVFKNYILLQNISGTTFTKSNFASLKIFTGKISYKFSRSSQRRRFFIASRFNFIYVCYTLFSKLWLNYLLTNNFLKLKNCNFVLKSIFIRLLKYFL